VSRGAPYAAVHVWRARVFLHSHDGVERVQAVFVLMRRRMGEELMLLEDQALQR
jgi:hypothetical protein